MSTEKLTAGTIGNRHPADPGAEPGGHSPADQPADRGAEVSADRRIGTALELWVVLARCCSAVACRAEEDVARHGLTPGEFGVLEALYHRGPLLLGELQRKVLVSSGGVTYLVDRLAQRGLVERRACPSDRRARYAALTEQGHDLIERIFPDHAEAVARALSGVDLEEQRRLANQLRKVGLYAASLGDGSGP